MPILTSPEGLRLKQKYLSSKIYSLDDTFTDAHLQAVGSEFDDVWTAFRDILNQLFITTATWSLDRWEQELGVVPQPAKSDDERRSTVLSKFRGSGTATISVIKSICDAYENGSVIPVEDQTAYTVTIRFISLAGIPPNMDDLQTAIRAALPANLKVIYQMSFLTYDSLDARNWTWDQFDAQNLTWDQLELLL